MPGVQPPLYLCCAGGHGAADHRVGAVAGPVSAAQVPRHARPRRHRRHLLAGGRLHLPRQPPVRVQQLRRRGGRGHGHAGGAGPAAHRPARDTSYYHGKNTKTKTTFSN